MKNQFALPPHVTGGGKGLGLDVLDNCYRRLARLLDIPRQARVVSVAGDADGHLVGIDPRLAVERLELGVLVAACLPFGVGVELGFACCYCGERAANSC